MRYLIVVFLLFTSMIGFPQEKLKEKLLTNLYLGIENNYYLTSKI